MDRDDRDFEPWSPNSRKVSNKVKCFNRIKGPQLLVLKAPKTTSGIRSQCLITKKSTEVSTSHKELTAGFKQILLCYARRGKSPKDLGL